MSDTPRWTPEEIAALIDGLVEDPATRARLEQAVAADPAARSLAAAMRGDAAHLSASMRTRIAAIPAAEFKRGVMNRIAKQSAPPPKAAPLAFSLGKWKGALLVLGLLGAAAIVAHSSYRRLTAGLGPLPGDNEMVGCITQEVLMRFTVVNSTGQPIAGASLVVTPVMPALATMPPISNEPVACLRGATGTDGIAEVHALAMMPFDVDVNSPGRRPLRVRIDAREAHGGVFEQRLVVN